MKAQFEILMAQLEALTHCTSTLRESIVDGHWKSAGQILKQNIKSVDSIKNTIQTMVDISQV